MMGLVKLTAILQMFTLGYCLIRRRYRSSPQKHWATCLHYLSATQQKLSRLGGRLAAAHPIILLITYFINNKVRVNKYLPPRRAFVTFTKMGQSHAATDTAMDRAAGMRGHRHIKNAGQACQSYCKEELQVPCTAPFAFARAIPSRSFPR